MSGDSACLRAYRTPAGRSAVQMAQETDPVSSLRFNPIKGGGRTADRYRRRNMVTRLAAKFAVTVCGAVIDTCTAVEIPATSPDQFTKW